MADKAKKVSIKLPDGTIGDIPEENVQEALKRGAQLADTAPPPSIPAQVVSAIGGKASERTIEPAVSTAMSTLKKTGEFLAGVGTGATALPGQIVRLAGGDPSKIQVPFVYQETETGERKPATLESIGRAPETTAGKAGEITGEVLQLMAPGKAATLAVSKLPKIASVVTKAGAKLEPVTKAAKAVTEAYPKSTEALKYAGRIGGSTAVSATQEASKTGEVEAAVESAEKGALLDAALNAMGRGAKYYAPKVRDYLAKTVLPKANIGEEYQQDLANRLVETGSKFTKEGIGAIQKRLKFISDKMDEAVAKADDWMNEASVLVHQGGMKDPTGKIPSFPRIVDVKTKLTENWNKFKDKDLGYENLPPEDKAAYDKIFNGIVGTIPGKGSQDLTFSKADEIKGNLYKQLHEFYERVKDPKYTTTADEARKEKVREVIARSMREAIQDGLEVIKDVRSKISPPPGTLVDKSKPWEVQVGKNTFMDIKKAGQLAMKDADLATIGQKIRDASGPQLSQATGEPLMTSVALAQLMHGSIVTPSQVAALAYKARGPEFKTQRLIPATTFLTTARPPVSAPVGTTVFSRTLFGNERQTSRPEPTQTEIPKGADYWSKPPSR